MWSFLLKNFSRNTVETQNIFVCLFQDFALDYGIVAESFETSVPWDKCEKLCFNVKAVVAAECEKHGIQYYIISCRVTQTYDAGACVYFYFGFRNLAHSDPVHTYEEIENKARDEILASGKITDLWKFGANEKFNQADPSHIITESEKFGPNGTSKVFLQSVSIFTSLRSENLTPKIFSQLEIC